MTQRVYPGFILVDDCGGHMALTLPEIAAILGEWDRAIDLTHTERRNTKLPVRGETPALWIEWDRYSSRPTIAVRRGSGADSVWVEKATIAEMRALLEAAR